MVQTSINGRIGCRYRRKRVPGWTGGASTAQTLITARFLLPRPTAIYRLVRRLLSLSFFSRSVVFTDYYAEAPRRIRTHTKTIPVASVLRREISGGAAIFSLAGLGPPSNLWPQSSSARCRGPEAGVGIYHCQNGRHDITMARRRFEIPLHRTTYPKTSRYVVRCDPEYFRVTR